MQKKKRDNNANDPELTIDNPVRYRLSKNFNKILMVIGIVLLLALSYAGYLYASTPEVIRKPLLEHYHFRMQIVINQNPEDFGQNKYQVAYAKDQCNAELPAQPIHFHDNKNQFVHIHWEGMTGGLVMKYYGWNYIGGYDGILGYKLTNLFKPEKIPIHGNLLPNKPDPSKFYIYTGDENGYKSQSFEDWKNKDLEDFFGKTSNSPSHELNKKQSFMDRLFPQVSAHNGETHKHGAAEAGIESEEEKLTRINNLIGNVVVFVQNEHPSDEQIKDRFKNLIPLGDSTCGG